MRDLSQDLNQTNHKKTTRIISVFNVNVTLASMIVILGLVYIYTVNAMSTQSFRIKQLGAELDSITAEHKSLELENSHLQSVSSIQLNSLKLNFVPATDVSYIKADSVALK